MDLDQTAMKSDDAKDDGQVEKLAKEKMDNEQSFQSESDLTHFDQFKRIERLEANVELLIKNQTEWSNTMTQFMKGTTDSLSKLLGTKQSEEKPNESDTSNSQDSEQQVFHKTDQLLNSGEPRQYKHSLGMMTPDIKMSKSEDQEIELSNEQPLKRIPSYTLATELKGAIMSEDQDNNNYPPRPYQHFMGIDSKQTRNEEWEAINTTQPDRKPQMPYQPTWGMASGYGASTKTATVTAMATPGPSAQGIFLTPTGLEAPELTSCTQPACHTFIKDYQTYVQMVGLTPSAVRIPVYSMMKVGMLRAIAKELEIQHQELTEQNVLRYIEDAANATGNGMNAIGKITFPVLNIVQQGSLDVSMWLEKVEGILRRENAMAHLDKKNPQLLKALQLHLIKFMEPHIQYQMNMAHKLGRGFFEWNEYENVLRFSLQNARMDKATEETKKSNTTWGSRTPNAFRGNRKKKQLDTSENKKGEAKEVQQPASNSKDNGTDHKSANQLKTETVPSIGTKQEAPKPPTCIGCRKMGHKIRDCQVVTDPAERKRLVEEHRKNKLQKSSTQ